MVAPPTPLPNKRLLPPTHWGSTCSGSSSNQKQRHAVAVGSSINKQQHQQMDQFSTLYPSPPARAAQQLAGSQGVDATSSSPGPRELTGSGVPPGLKTHRDRVRSRLSAWRDIGASRQTLRWLGEGVRVIMSTTASMDWQSHATDPPDRKSVV